MFYKILALKERPEYARSFKQMVEAHGYEILLVDTVEEALAALRADDDIDLVIVSVHLEDDNVFDLLRVMRQDDALKLIPIICLNICPDRFAVYINDSLEVAAKELGADKFITMKNYDGERLWKELTKVFSSLR